MISKNGKEKKKEVKQFVLVQKSHLVICPHRMSLV